MADVLPFPFATVDDLKQRWPDFPVGGEITAEVHLEDASQFILDVAPSAATVHERTRRRIVCAVVRRAMQADSADMAGMESVQVGTGPFQDTFKLANPHGDYYLTAMEKRALGVGRQVAFTVPMRWPDETDN